MKQLCRVCETQSLAEMVGVAVKTCIHIPPFKWIGSVSWGTMRPEDLIPRFLDVLDTFESTEEIRKETEAEDFDYASESAAHILDELFERLSAYAPRFFYFGATEGDGSDYGFWFDSESFREAQHFKEIRFGSELPESNEGDDSAFYVISDHGNIACYAWCGHARCEDWQEVWSVC